MKIFTPTLVLIGSVSAMVGCSSAPEPTFGSGEEEYGHFASVEYNVLSDVVIDNFHKQLVLLQEAVAGHDADAEQSVLARLRQESLQYRGAIENGVADESPRTRAISAAMLGFTGDAKYAIQLAQIAVTMDENPSVSQFATVGLAVLGGRINESTKREDVIAYLMRLMLPSNATWTMRINAVTAYGRAYSAARGDTLTPLTDTMVQDPHPSVRKQALSVARDLKDSGVLPEVTRVALKDPDNTIRAAAAVTLGSITDPRALEALTEAMADASPMVRSQAVYSLVAQRTIEPELVADLIVDALADFDDNVRENAAKAAGEIGGERFSRPLLQSLNDQSDAVRLAVINALANVIPYNNRRDGFPLVSLLDDGEQTIATATYRALKKITGEQMERSSDVWRQWYYDNFKDLDPEWVYRDQPRPRFQPSGIRSSSSRPRSTPPRTSPPRTPPRR